MSGVWIANYKIAVGMANKPSPSGRGLGEGLQGREFMAYRPHPQPLSQRERGGGPNFQFGLNEHAVLLIAINKKGRSRLGSGPV